MLIYDKEINGLSSPLTKICLKRKNLITFSKQDSQNKLPKQPCSSKNNNSESTTNLITSS